MWITASPEMGQSALDAGADRIFIDLETLGKRTRQGGISSHFADHRAQDVERMRNHLPGAEILVRTDGMNENTGCQVEAVLKGEPDYLMLPMFKSVEDVRQYEELVDGRAKITLLAETPQALARLPDILENTMNVHEVHIGLNDLHLGLGLDFLFEPLAGGLVEAAAKTAKEFNVRFGFGGIARVGEGDVPAELLLSEHVRLGSKMVILSRAFRGNVETSEQLGNEIDLAGEIRKIRDWEEKFRNVHPRVLMENSKHLRRLIYEEARRRR